MSAKVVSISLPEYSISHKPDYERLGQKVDSVIESYFPDDSYLMRAIGKDDHPNLTLDQLVEIIITTGTDRYDPNRKPIAYENFVNYNYDIQAEKFEIKDKKINTTGHTKTKSLFGETAYDFYENALHDRGYSVRIDLLLIYGCKQFYQSQKIDSNLPGVEPKYEKFLFKFKNPRNKPDALVGIVKIIRD